MTKAKLGSELAKVHSTLHKDIHRLRQRCHKLDNKNMLRKFQVTQCSKFISKLIEEGRVTREEVKQYFEPLKVTKEKFKNKS